MLFLTHYYKKTNITFNSNKFSQYTNFIGFQYYAVSNLNNLAFSLLKTIVGYSKNTSTFKQRKKKLYNSQFRY